LWEKKRRQKMQITALENEIRSKLKKKTLILDTSLFIDGYENPEKIKPFTELCDDIECSLITMDSMYLEFIKGTNLKEDFKKKREYLEELIFSLYPTSKQSFNEANNIARALRENGGNIDPSDYLLATVIKKHPKKVFLLTKNYRHFPSPIFKKDIIIPFVTLNNVSNYYIISFDSKVYTKELKRLENQGS